MIDFTTLFAKQEIERLNFQTRRGVNYEHEVIFLSSYLHDGRFRRRDVQEAGRVIRIVLERDCWEFCSRLHEGRKTLLWAPSVLEIAGVDACRWSRDPGDAELWIRSVFIGESQYLDKESDIAHLVIDCGHQDVRIDLFGGNSYFDITLRDLADPA